MYNKADYIAKALNSVITQSFSNFELILVDDGSTDNSSMVAESVLSNSSIEYHIIVQDNKGVSTARNNGVKLSKYKYIAFLDADDWWEKDYLERMTGIIEKFPNAGIWSSSFYIIKNEEKSVAKLGVESDFIEGSIDYFNVYSNTLTMPVWTGATIIKKTIFAEFDGFNPNLKLGEDFDLWIKVSLKYPVVLLNVPLSNYNQDVDPENRAIGLKFYQPEEHVLFQDYDKLRFRNISFDILYSKLALYSLKPYYMYQKNQMEVKRILNTILAQNIGYSDVLFYRFWPRKFLRFTFFVKMNLSKLKRKFVI